MSEINMEELQASLDKTRTRVGELSEAGETMSKAIANIANLANSAGSGVEEVKKDIAALKQAMRTSFSQMLMGISMVSEKTAQSTTLINALLMYLGGYSVEEAKDYLRSFFSKQEKKMEELKKLEELRKSAGETTPNKEVDVVEEYMEIRDSRLKMVDPNFNSEKFWGLLDLLTIADSLGQQPDLQKLEAGFAQFDEVQQKYANRNASKVSNVVELKPQNKD